MAKTMMLRVELSEVDRLKVLDDLSGKLTKLEDLEAMKTSLPEKIKNLRGSIHHMNESLKARQMEREVEIREEPNGFSGTISVYRVDTGELVTERPMDPDERQLRLGETAIPGRITNLADARTEEQVVAGTPEEAEELRAARLKAEREERIGTLAAELTDKAVVTTLDPIEEGAAPRFKGTITHGEGDAAIVFEIGHETAEEAKTTVCRRAAEGIVAIQEEAEAAARAAAAPADPIDATIAAVASRVLIKEEGDLFFARIDGAIDGLPDSDGFSGPVRTTTVEATDALLAELRTALKEAGQHATTWSDVEEASRQAEIKRLAEDQEKDAAKDGPKTFLKAPKGAKSKRVKVTDEKGETLSEGAADEPPAPGPDPGVDTTPPVDGAF